MQSLNLVISRTRELETLHEDINNGLTSEILHADLYHELIDLLTDAKEEQRQHGGDVDIDKLITRARENCIRACVCALDEAEEEARERLK